MAKTKFSLKKQAVAEDQRLFNVSTPKKIILIHSHILSQIAITRMGILKEDTSDLKTKHELECFMQE